MNCFAYTEKGCRALNVSECLGQDCGFLKTPEKAEADRRIASARIAMLDDTRRQYISDTYYGGSVSSLGSGVTK